MFSPANAPMVEGDNKTIWCGNLAEQVTEELLYELFLQAGPLERVRIARDRDKRPKHFAFITYVHDVSVPYAVSLFRGTTLFNRTLTLQCRGRMAMLPPPIRCHGPDVNMDFANQPNVIQQFANMTENFHETEKPKELPRHKEADNRLVIASLQGNWTHRHHPYRTKDLPNSRHNYRHQDDNHTNRHRTVGSWRERRPKKSHYYRRD